MGKGCCLVGILDEKKKTAVKDKKSLTAVESVKNEDLSPILFHEGKIGIMHKQADGL